MPPGVKLSGRADARVWLGRNPNMHGFASNTFSNNGQAIRLVQSLYAAGASSVILAGIHGEPWRLREEGGPIADTLFVKLPADAATAQAVARAVVRSSDRPDEFSSVLDHKKIVTASELPHIGRRERAITPEDVRGGQTLRLWWD